MKIFRLIIVVLLSTLILSGCDTVVLGTVSSIESDSMPGEQQEGVQLALTGKTTLLNNDKYLVATSAEDGGYSYDDLPWGRFTITPSLEGYKFKPASRSFFYIGFGLKGMNFHSYQHELWYEDTDGDGFGNGNSRQDAESQPEGYAAEAGDCNDDDALISPAQADIPDDDIDQNCDGRLAGTWYRDADKDSFGTVEKFVIAETKPYGYVSDNTDCNDAARSIYPDAQEIAGDGIDQNCNGEDDTNWYPDEDGDGFGATVEPVVSVFAPTGYVASNSDCDDSDSSINRIALEISNDGIDQNCDGNDLRSWYMDADGDGFGTPGPALPSETQPEGYSQFDTDCNDTDDTINPDAEEIASDGIDQNCDGKFAVAWYEDNDADNFGDDNTEVEDTASPGPNYVLVGGDCDDTTNTIYPDAPEIVDDGIDQDCDGDDQLLWYADVDGDGFGDNDNSLAAETKPAGYVVDNTDCDDGNSAINPGATEVPIDGIDQDCNGTDSWVWYSDSDGDGFGSSNDTTSSPTQPEGYSANALDCDDADSSVSPVAEEVTDDGVDQNCNGSDQQTWYQDVDGDGFGDSSVSIIIDALSLGNYATNAADCDDYNASVNPSAAEISNGIDDNCNGDIDEE